MKPIRENGSLQDIPTTMHFSNISCIWVVLAVSNDRLRVTFEVQNLSVLEKVGGANQWLVWQNMKLLGQPPH